MRKERLTKEKFGCLDIFLLLFLPQQGIIPEDYMDCYCLFYIGNKMASLTRIYHF